MIKPVLHLLPVLLALLFAAPAQAADCDRQCLRMMADTYLAAMVAHDPRKAPLAPDIVIVENIKRIAPGEGLWATASAVPGAFRIYVPDVKAQQIGLIAVMEEGGKPIELGLRLKVVNGRIVEAEQVVVHQLPEPNLKNLQRPRTAFGQPVPEPYRDSRGRLLSIAASYYDALDENNGSLAPFADDCARRENGFQTARNPIPDDPGSEWLGVFGSMGCAAQLDSQVMSYITRIDDRRVWIADEETGLAFGLSHFRHAMERKEIAVLGVPGMASWKLPFDPFDLPAAHIFKIWGGKIHQIEALGFLAPYNSPTGWEK
jgi:hypothetical protein